MKREYEKSVKNAKNSVELNYVCKKEEK